MSSSRLGRGPAGSALRTKRSCFGPAGVPGIIGSQSEAGATEASMTTFFGPVRRSIVPAIARLQLPAACPRSAAVISMRTSFSASATVAAETGGPTGGAVPKAGGVPAAGVAAGAGDACPAAPFATAAAPRTPAAVCARNSRRDSDMGTSMSCQLSVLSFQFSVPPDSRFATRVHFAIRRSTLARAVRRKGRTGCTSGA